MKKKLLLKYFSLCTGLVLAMMTTSKAQSGFAVVGNGTTSNDQYSYPAPYGNYYWGARHQMLVTVAELSAAGITPGMQISSIGFNITNLNGAPSHLNWAVTVYTTTLNDPIAGGYLTSGAVSTSTITTATGVIGWNQTPIAPFTWNGTDNLVVETCFYNSSYIYNYSTEWTTNLPGTTVKTRWTQQDVVYSCPNAYYSTSTDTRPNIRFEYPLSPCTNPMSPNSVVAPTFSVCPNSTVALSLGVPTGTLSGISYQWYASNQSSVGLWTAISGATNQVSASPQLTATTWFQAVLTCSNGGGGTITTSPAEVNLEPTTTDVVPYLEDFENVKYENALPNCSWSIPNIGTAARTLICAQSGNRAPRSGSKYAVFSNSSPGTNYFYTNGIYMEPGVTYSASVWYQTDLTGANNWSDLSILLGTAQNSTGLTTIATTGGPAVSLVYKSLSNTFTVASSGLYYVAVRATGGSGTAQFLSWDDLAIDVPCKLNTPTVTATASKNTICQGESVALNATGANAFMWDNNGGPGASISVSPMYNTLYTATGTHTASGCSSKASVMITVNPSPVVNVIANPPESCKDAPVTLQATGAQSYIWSSGSNAASAVVAPSTSTSYTVTGSNSYGCSRKAVYNLVVHDLPSVTASGDNTICKGESTSLVASGANTYLWKSNNVYISGNPVSVSPQVNTTYTVEGTDENGCVGVYNITLLVDPCVGLGENTAAAGIRVYPNPTSGVFTIHGSALNAPIQVSDVTGRILLSVTAGYSSTDLDVSAFAAGIYYVNIPTAQGVEIIKLIKE